jgi:hypothetical protein
LQGDCDFEIGAAKGKNCARYEGEGALRGEIIFAQSA